MVAEAGPDLAAPECMHRGVNRSPKPERGRRSGLPEHRVGGGVGGGACSQRLMKIVLPTVRASGLSI
jgi:hypothetical protein